MHRPIISDVVIAGLASSSPMDGAAAGGCTRGTVLDGAAGRSTRHGATDDVTVVADRAGRTQVAPARHYHGVSSAPGAGEHGSPLTAITVSTVMASAARRRRRAITSDPLTMVGPIGASRPSIGDPVRPGNVSADTL